MVLLLSQQWLKYFTTVHPLLSGWKNLALILPGQLREVIHVYYYHLPLYNLQTTATGKLREADCF